MEYQMKKTFNYLAITSCFVLGTTLAHANPNSSQGNMHEQMFKTMDANSDGMVTRDEFDNYGKKKFQEMDANGDGQVTAEEMKAMSKKMDGSGRDSKGKERSQWDNTNSKNTSMGGRSNSSLSPQDSSANRSSNSMSDSWDKKRDDAWHQSMDNSWDKKRDDAWHKANDNDDDND
jgi:hypothetical protein